MTPHDGLIDPTSSRVFGRGPHEDNADLGPERGHCETITLRPASGQNCRRPIDVSITEEAVRLTWRRALRWSFLHSGSRFIDLFCRRKRDRGSNFRKLVGDSEPTLLSIPVIDTLHGVEYALCERMEVNMRSGLVHLVEPQ